MKYMALTDTKRKITRAATALFAHKGLEGVSIREISRRAGVNLAAINYHFQSKEQLYSAIITQHFQKMRDFLAELEREGIKDEESYVQRFVECHFQLLFHNSKEMELIIARELSVASARREFLIQEFFVPILSSLIAIIKNGIHHGRFRKVDPTLAALSLVGVCVFYANKRELIETLVNIDVSSESFRKKAAAHTAELFLRGIRKNAR
ncbi:MAG: TetR/AcrR family transcriptional regulator [Acidobacteria bacterium]|nr:TetR/AcrR family transcriptional regulator [Acidobacteriota bacterium]